MRTRSVLIGGTALAATWCAALLASSRRRLGGRDEPTGGEAAESPVRGHRTLAISTTGRAGRTARLGALTVRGASRRVWFRVRSLRADADRRAEIDNEYAIRTAADVAAELGQMRGVLMKVGQMVSFLAESLPEPTRQALSSLQEAAPPMAPALASAVVTEDLGARPERLFERWDGSPVAAASIGQVHKAVASGGDEVAVKVQYPGVEAAIRADLDNTALLYNLVGRWFDSIETASLVEEFRSRITDELDYHKEAKNQVEFGAMFAGHPWVRIPRPFPEYSSRRVLSSEWIDGSRFDEFVAEATDEVRQRTAEVIWRFSQHSIHRHLVFNGDPHPGNYRFHHDGTVTFLDFGMVKRWTPREWNVLRRTLEAVIVDREPEAICDAMRRSGFLNANRAVDPVRVAAYVSAAYEPYLCDEFEFSTDWLNDTLRRTAAVRGANTDVTNALNIPPSFLILNRVVWGVNALLSRLEARGPYRAMLLEYISGGEPASEMGIAEAEWRRSVLDERQR